MNIKEDDIRKIKDILKKELDPLLIYVFGSAVEGFFYDDSDIDIAFFAEKNTTQYEVHMIAQKIASLLSRDIDLINLKKATTVLKAQVVGNGIVIYSKNKKFEQSYKIKVFKEYALLNEERSKILQSVKRKGIIYG